MKLIRRFDALLLLSILLCTGCARQPLPSEVSKKGKDSARPDENLPFNQPKQEEGISPSSSLVPSPADLPAGTPFTIRLKSSISSASAQAGDAFEAVLDEAVIVQGKPILPAGVAVSGMVVAVNHYASDSAPAYLRLKATSIAWRSKTIAIESSSIFAKAGVSHDQQENSSQPGKGFSRAKSNAPRVVRFASGRRLTFRLITPAVMPQ